MTPRIAMLVFVTGITGLFLIDRERKSQTSAALWLPVIWLWIFGSREISLWMAAIRNGESVAYGDTYLDGSPVDRIVYSCLMFLGILVLARRGPKVTRLLQANLPIVLFFIYCAMSVVWSDHPDIALKRWIKSLGDLIMVIIVLTERDWLAAMRRLLARIAFLLIPVSILLIKYYPSIGKSFKHYGTPIYMGVTTNKNILGVVCLLCGLGSLWRFLGALRDRKMPHRSRHLLAHGTLLAMVFWLFGMAHSMTGLACFLLGATVMVTTSMGAFARRPGVVHVLVVSVVFVSFATLFLGAGDSSLQAMGKDVTLTGRTEIWRLVLGMTGNPLVGTGFESFWLPGWRRDKIWDLYWWHPNEAHNGYIEVFLNLGWIGICLMAGLIVTGYRNILAVLRREPDIGRVRLAYFVVAVIYNFTEAGFRMLDPIWIFFLLVTMAVPRPLTRSSKSSSPAVAASHDQRLVVPELETEHALPLGGRLSEYS
jgi:exopolysaccharide production protein ExoQ